jgi:hypothetical protein
MYGLNLEFKTLQVKMYNSPFYHTTSTPLRHVKWLTYQIQILLKLSCQYTKQNFEPMSVNFSIFF